MVFRQSGDKGQPHFVSQGRTIFFRGNLGFSLADSAYTYHGQKVNGLRNFCQQHNTQLSFVYLKINRCPDEEQCEKHRKHRKFLGLYIKRHVRANIAYVQIRLAVEPKHVQVIVRQHPCVIALEIVKYHAHDLQCNSFRRILMNRLRSNTSALHRRLHQTQTHHHDSRIWST